MSNSLHQEFKYYLDNKEELVKNYAGKYIVIKDHKIIGVFDSEFQAVEEISKTHKIGTFLVQKCDPGESSHTMTFHTRVAFI